MTGVRVLVGTKKGAFILTADGKRKSWTVSGPHFAGWEIYHLKGSPADPNRIYASQTSGWFGQIIQRSDDGGKTWEPPGSVPGDLVDATTGMPKAESNKFVYDTSPTGRPLTTHQWYDGTQHPWEFKRVWHLEPVAARSGRCVRRRRGRGAVSDGGRRQDLAGARGPARARVGAALAAGCGWDVPAHGRARRQRPEQDLHRDLGRGHVPLGRRRRKLAPDQQGPEVRSTSRRRRPRWAIACIGLRCTRHVRTCCSCRSIGT